LTTKSTTLNDVDFLRLQATANISRVNCAEVAVNKPRRLAYAISSLKRRLQQFKFWPLCSRSFPFEASNLGIFQNAQFLL